MTADTPADRAAIERLREHAERVIRTADQARYYSPYHIELARDAIAALEEVASLVSELADLRAANETVLDRRSVYLNEIAGLRAEVERLTAERDHIREERDFLVSEIGMYQERADGAEAECVTLRQALAEIVGHAYNILTQGESSTQLRQPSAQRLYDIARGVSVESSDRSE